MERSGPYQSVSGDDLLAATVKVGENEVSLTFPWGEQYFYENNGERDGKNSGHGQPINAYGKQEV